MYRARPPCEGATVLVVGVSIALANGADRRLSAFDPSAEPIEAVRNALSGATTDDLAVAPCRMPQHRDLSQQKNEVLRLSL